MSSVPTKFLVIKRRTSIGSSHPGAEKVCIRKYLSPRSWIPEGYETVYSILPEEAPILHAALTKYLAEENASNRTEN